MAENKTQPTEVDVAEFLAAVEHPTRRADALALDKMFREVTGWQPRMWGPTIVGYGSYHYIYDSGHEGDAIATGFSFMEMDGLQSGDGCIDPGLLARGTADGRQGRGFLVTGRQAHGLVSDLPGQGAYQ